MKLLAALAITVLTANVGLAQQRAPAEAMTFAKKVAAANTFEIESSQLALEHAQSADVKSFAQQMISDHTKAGEEFKQAIAAAGVSPPPPTRQEPTQNSN